MNIAIFSELFHPSTGGQELRYRELGSYLCQSGHSVDVYTLRYEPGLEREEVIDGIRVMRAPDSFGYLRNRWPRRRVSGILLFGWHVRRILAQKSQEYDLLIFNQWPIFHIVLAHRRRPYRVVIDWCEVRTDLLMRWLQRQMVRNGDYHLCVSRDVRDSLIRKCGVRPGDSLLLESGIEFRKYRVRGRERAVGGPRLLFIGRLARHKRIDLAMAVFRELLRTYPTSSFDVVGDGPIRADIQAQHADLVAEGCLRFWGFVEDRQKIHLLSQSDFLVLMSEREGFPRVVAEAMASGVPIITTNHSGNGAAEIVDRLEIGVVTSHAPTAVVEAIIDVWSDQALFRRFSENGRRHGTQLDWSTISGRLLSFVEKNA